MSKERMGKFVGSIETTRNVVIMLWDSTYSIAENTMLRLHKLRVKTIL